MPKSGGPINGPGGADGPGVQQLQAGGPRMLSNDAATITSARATARINAGLFVFDEQACACCRVADVGGGTGRMAAPAKGRWRQDLDEPSRRAHFQDQIVIFAVETSISEPA